MFLSQRPLSFATSLLLACALCIHSILEGLALGAQQSMQATEDIMLAIAAHKGLAAYALGASIVESRVSRCCCGLFVGLDSEGGGRACGCTRGLLALNRGHVSKVLC